MLHAYIDDGQCMETFDSPRPFTAADGSSVPKDAFSFSTEEKNALGIVAVNETPKPNRHAFNITGWTAVLQQGVWNQQWQTVEIPSEELPARLETVKTFRCAEVDGILAEKQDAGFTWNSHHFQIRDDDKVNFNSMVTVAILDPTIAWDTNFTWIDIDNEYVSIPTAQAMIQLGLTALQFFKTMKFKARDIKDTILDKTTIADVLAVDITAGW